MSLFINTPEPMVMLKLITIKGNSGKSIAQLQEMGVLHVEEAKELHPVDVAVIEKSRYNATKTINYIDDILSYLTEEKSVLLPDGTKPPSLGEIINETTMIHDRFSRLVEKIEELREELKNRQSLSKHLGVLADKIDLPLKDLHYSGDYLFTDVIVSSDEAHSIFKERTKSFLLQDIAVSVAGEMATYFIARKEDKKEIEQIIRDLGIVVLKIPDANVGLKGFLANNNEVIREIELKIKERQSEIQTFIEDNLEQVVFFKETLVTENERLSVLEKACEAKYVTLIEGWIPQSRKETSINILKETLQHVYIEAQNPSSVDTPPSRLQNPNPVKPFQVIVNLFSIPRYGDWDPTPIVAYFFAFFFGLMMNDMVYAIGLLLLSRFVLGKLVDDPSSENVHLFRNVLYISAGSSLAFGLLSGTYLGDFLNKYFAIDLETIALAKELQKQLSDPISFIILSLIVGLIHVNSAHVLALIKGIKEGNKGLIISKGGLFFTQIFGIPYIFRALLHKELLPLSADIYSVIPYLLIISIIVIITGTLMQMGSLGGIFWIFDLTGLLGDVMSYSRLAGVGLATFYLASSFNLLADWLSSILSNLIPGIIGSIISFIAAVVMLFILHTFNLLLSSLAAFIHSLRLCFVEFLLKFYEGGGIKYSPLELKHRKQVIVGVKS